MDRILDAAPRRPGPGLLARLRAAAGMRRALLALDARLLRDVGLSRAAALEGGRPAWDAPAHWRR